ncbi:virion structural protein [Dinoroseobacter phage DFL12phi1]|uniref:F5/8 type C domain-containing protein n=1 Tax=Dinoroseobacter phage DFL12phi1 TaxID=1477404 RepID=A0A023NHY0_9CAUD|nr:virion structural protein [Dinoroseobacter phage DFL12phi1]AHX01049.1 hypothetical protein DFL12P1_0003 [Dinoroseobacter phage DFL12phi1]
MPHPISYPVGTQDDDRTRSIDVVHIEPSIREGVHLVSSLYGPLASAPLYRFPPTNTFPPYLTGDPQIPSVLTCNSGQWAASPAAVLYYQWMADGVDIPGANGPTWTSTVEYDNTVITCEVRGANYLGEDYALTSNSIAISLIEPIELEEMENYFITGLNQGEKAQTVRDERTLVTSGIGALNRLDINRGVAYFTTGISALNRSDINASNYNFITGISQKDTLSVLERTFGIGVVNWDTGAPLVDGEPQPMNLKNPDAEAGLAGWETFGPVSYVGKYGGFTQSLDDVHAGNLTFFGGENTSPSTGNTPYTYMTQDVEIFPIWHADVDAGTTSVWINWFQHSESGADQANIRIEFYAANDTLLGVNDGPGLWASPSGIHFYRELVDTIPTGTRYIRIQAEFNWQLGDDTNAHIDTISMQIFKGSRGIGTDQGPDFNMWRLRFLTANTWSGGALSELEFRDTPGTIDLATGGQPVFGSAGNGVSNADAAFDDLRDTNYWAGAQNSISEGTSWVGYDFGTPVKPGEIEITARPGSNALQVPRTYMIEGSDDGIRWIPHHLVDQDFAGGDYNSGERRQILVPKGVFAYHKDTPGGAGFTASRQTNQFDDFPAKGNVFYCHSRLNITHLGALINDGTGLPFNYKLQLYRMNNQKDSIFSDGMVSEAVLESISGVANNAGGGVNSSYWADHACVNGPHHFEVGEMFMVYFIDMDAATNPENPNEARTWYFTNFGTETFKMARRIVTPLRTFNKFDTDDLVVGELGEGNSITDDWLWTLDFRGQIF